MGLKTNFAEASHYSGTGNLSKRKWFEKNERFNTTVFNKSHGVELMSNAIAKRPVLGSSPAPVIRQPLVILARKCYQTTS